MPKHLLLNGTEPKWLLDDSVDTEGLQGSLGTAMEKGEVVFVPVILSEDDASRLLLINGANLVTAMVTESEPPTGSFGGLDVARARLDDR